MKIKPLFDIVVEEIDEVKVPYLRLQFDGNNAEHTEWLSEHIYCSEVSDGSSSHDYPTDLLIEIPLLAFVEAYYVLERYKRLSHIVIECSISSEAFKQQNRRFFNYGVTISAPEECEDNMPHFDFTLSFSEWGTNHEWILNFDLGMLDTDDYVDNIVCVQNLAEGLGRKMCETCNNSPSPLPAILDWGGGLYRGKHR